MDRVTNINDLPELPFLHIFKKLPNEDLFLASTVCSKWNFLAGKVGMLRKSLNLFIGTDAQSIIIDSKFNNRHQGVLKNIEDDTLMFPDCIPDYTWDAIQLSDLTEDTVYQLIDLFPKLTSLLVAINTYPSDLDHLHLLLIQCQPTIVTFKFFVQYHDEPRWYSEPELPTKLLQAVNQMAVLKSLTIDVEAEFIKYDDDISLPILANLEEFNFNSRDVLSKLTNSLLTYAQPNAALQVIRLGVLYIVGPDITYQLEPAFLATRVKQLLMDVSDNFGNLHLDFRMDAFTSLTKLELYFGALEFETVTFDDVLEALQSHHQLIDLTLALCIKRFNIWAKEALNHNMPFIKVLTFEFFESRLPRHSYFEDLQLQTLFPALQLLYLRNAEYGLICENCLDTTYKPGSGDATPEKHNQCIDMLLRPLEDNCQHLKLVDMVIPC